MRVSARAIRAMAWAAATLAIPARADVLELSATGATWIARAGAVTPQAAAADPVIAPSSATMSLGLATVPPRWRAHVAALAARYDLSPALIAALVWQESRWRENARSVVGARGLAQLMPGTARELGVNPDEPHANLEGGARYLRAQLDRFDGNIEKALAAYNAGPARVVRANGIPPIAETRSYVGAIVGRLNDSVGD